MSFLIENINVLVRWLRNLNRVLLTVIPLLLMGMVLVLVLGKFVTVPTSADQKTLILPTSQNVTPTPFSQYAAQLGRKVFEGRGGGSRRGMAVTLDGEASHLTLQGIFMDDNPQALVLDKRSNRSLRVTKGQMIGRIRVQAVENDGIVLFYNGRTMKLSL